MKRTKQLNIRMVPELHAAADKVADHVSFSREEIGEVAYALLFGTRDSLILAKREKIVKAFKTLRIEIPFDYPCPPMNNNAILTSRGDSDNFAAVQPELDGVVAQLVEHHNGIEAVSGNNNKGECKSGQKRAVGMAPAAAALGGAATIIPFCE